MEATPAIVNQKEYSKEQLNSLALEWTKAMWNNALWKQVRWMGVPVLQWPTDLVVMQELIVQQRPRIIVETGTYQGGTAIYYASILEMARIDGRVITIDIQCQPDAKSNIDSSVFSNRIHPIEGDSKSEAVHKELRHLIGEEKNVLICLDSDHSYAHTLGELRAFASYVPIGGYMVLFDTICRYLADTPNGDPAWIQDSPMSAMEEFISGNPNFAVAPEWEKYLVSFAPSGFLVRKS